MIDTAAELPDAQRLEIYEAVMKYGMDDVEPTELSREADIMFSLLRPLIDVNNKKFYDGKKGGRPKKTTFLPVVKTTFKPNDNVNVNDNLNVNENVNENERDINAHAYAGSEFAETEKFYNELREELLGDTTTLSDLQLQVKKTRGELLRYLDTFHRTERIAGRTAATRTDYRHHFTQWLYGQIRNGNSPEVREKQTTYKTETEKILHNADTFTADTAGSNDFE